MGAERGQEQIDAKKHVGNLQPGQKMKRATRPRADKRPAAGAREKRNHNKRTLSEDRRRPLYARERPGICPEKKGATNPPKDMRTSTRYTLPQREYDPMNKKGSDMEPVRSQTKRDHYGSRERPDQATSRKTMAALKQTQRASEVGMKSPRAHGKQVKKDPRGSLTGKRERIS